MMFKGSDKFPQDVYADLFKNAGVDNGAYTTNDYTNYHLDFSKDHLDKVFKRITLKTLNTPMHSLKLRH